MHMCCDTTRLPLKRCLLIILDRKWNSLFFLRILRTITKKYSHCMYRCTQVKMVGLESGAWRLKFDNHLSGFLPILSLSALSLPPSRISKLRFRPVPPVVRSPFSAHVIQARGEGRGRDPGGRLQRFYPFPISVAPSSFSPTGDLRECSCAQNLESALGALLLANPKLRL